MHSWKKKILLQSSVHLCPIFQIICNPMNIKVCIANKAIKEKFLKTNLNEDLLIILQLAEKGFNKHLIDDDDLDAFPENTTQHIRR